MRRPVKITRYRLGRVPALAGITGGPSLRLVPSFFILFSSMLWFVLPANLNAQERDSGSASTKLRQQGLPESPSSAAATRRQFEAAACDEYPISSQPANGGIKEVIPDKYKKRYEEWKKEFLASEIGRRQWEMYTHQPRLVLTITVSGDRRDGAHAGKFTWDDSGNLIAATITLGPRIDKGYPDPVYYPVLSSLERLKSSFAVSGKILAAAKIAHELGHIDQALDDGARYRRQNQTAPVYNAILLSNGHNARDPRLINLAREMGRTPVEISEDREYRAEANALRYLMDRITKESLRRSLFTRIEQAIDRYAKRFGERFIQVAQCDGPDCPFQSASNHPNR